MIIKAELDEQLRLAQVAVEEFILQEQRREALESVPFPEEDKYQMIFIAIEDLWPMPPRR